MYCTNCKEERRSKYDAGCYGSCGERDCKLCCDNCNQHTLIETAVIRVIEDLRISKNSPILGVLQRLKAQVDSGNKDEFSWVIEQRTVSSYWGDPMVVTYNRNTGFITKNSFYSYKS